MKLLSALAALSLVSVTPSRGATPMIRAADFKPGVAIHFDAYGSPSREIAAIKALGIVRARLDAPQPDYLNAGNGYDALCSAGIRLTPFLNAWIDPSDDTSTHAEFAATEALEQKHPGCIENIEGPNEVNNFPMEYHGLSGSDAAQAFQSTLYGRVKNSAVLSAKPVLGYTDEHPVDSPSDLANFHPYVGSWWQDYEIAQIAPQMPRKPWAATEYGWNTSPTQTDRTVTESVQAQRLVAGVAAMAASGFEPAFIFELRDEGTSPTDLEAHWGLYRADWSAKPAALYLTHMLATLTDSGSKAASFTPKAFAPTFSDPSVCSLVVAKSDGSYVLLFWMNKHLGDPPSVFDVNLGSTRTITAIHVEDGRQVAFGRMQVIKGYSFADTGSLSILLVSAS